MKWKKFTDEMPKTTDKILIRYIDTEYNSYLELSCVRRPYDANPKKYSPDYYEIQTIFSGGKFIPICDDYISKFEWLDPFEDKIT